MPQRPNPFLPAALALALLGGGLACKKPAAKPKPKDPKVEGVTSTELVQRGEWLLKRRKWEEGRRTLRFLEENLPGTMELPKAKLLLGDSFFFAGTPSYPEAMVEYQGFLSYFPRHDNRDYALYHIALCHFAAIESAERDQTETKKAIEAFNALLAEAPGSPYATDAKARIIQCWRRIAESELMIGIHYVNVYNFPGAERRLKALLETYPEYVDRERAYYFLGDALRRRNMDPEVVDRYTKDYLAKVKREDLGKLSVDERKEFSGGLNALVKAEMEKYREEARGYFNKLVESYPQSEWAGRARDRLLEMGQGNLKEELDS